MKISDVTIPKFLFHATFDEVLPSILKNGLVPGSDNWEDSDGTMVYLAIDRDVAESYAETADHIDDSWDIVVLKIDTDTLDLSKLDIDSNVLDNAGDTFQYNGTIPPTSFEVLDG